jgi:hypothetical protein
MGFSMTTLAMILALCFLAGSLPPLVLLYLRERMHQERETAWTRIFCVKSLEIPAISMDANQEKQEAHIKKPDNRQRMSVPLAVPDFAKDVYRNLKRTS